MFVLSGASLEKLHNVCVYISVVDWFIMLLLSILLRRINVNLTHSRLTGYLNAS